MNRLLPSTSVSFVLLHSPPLSQDVLGEDAKVSMLSSLGQSVFSRFLRT